MKRKLFFMLFALVALVSFQTYAANPINSVWIKADTTGLNPTLPYSGNKTPLRNWLIYDATAKTTKINKSSSILDDGNINLFNVSQVGATDRLINIQSVNATAPLKLTYGGNDMTAFEVVQFKSAAGVPATGTSWGNLRETQALAPGMQGYLMPAQGGDGVALTDTTSDMLIVTSDKDGKLAINQLKDVIKANITTSPVFNDGTYVVTYYPNYNTQVNTTNATSLTNALAAKGQPAVTIVNGAYSRPVYYLNEKYLTLTAALGNFYDSQYLTQYHGTAVWGAYSDPANWTNGLPANFAGKLTPNDAFAAQPIAGRTEVFVMVVQMADATGAPMVSAPYLGSLSYVGDLRPVYIKLTEQCNCPQQFIAPKWMADNQLLNFPLSNQIWKLGVAANLSFDKNPTTGEAIVRDGISKVKFTYENIIHNGACAAVAGNTAFQSAVDVPLYRIQNANGDYLTVDSTTYSFDASGGTDKDVTGVKLIWVSKKYTTTAVAKENIALQLFAISGSQTNPDANKWYTECNGFTYLPLASYIADYSKGKVDTSLGLSYNVNLGMAGESATCNDYAPVNDITSSFRVGYMGELGVTTQQNLVVQNATGGGATSNTAITTKWQKLPLYKFGCTDGIYVQQNNASGKYYTVTGTMTPGKNTIMSENILAHWTMTTGANDTVTFKPELQTSIYGGTPCGGAQSQLTGKYFLVDSIAPNTYVAFDQTNYGVNGNYTPTLLTLYITCNNSHTSSFLDLEADGGYNLDASKLAILETPFIDRNITYKIVSDPTTPTAVMVDANKNVIKYQAYIKSTTQGNSDTIPTFLNVYRENRRDLTGSGKHVIPYYSFAVVVNSTEYFLNINQNNGADSVYWTDVKKVTNGAAIYTELTTTEVKNKSTLGNLYKFCLPYKANPDSSRAATVTYGDRKLPPVYIQSMETSINDTPYLVVTGAATKYLTARKLTDALMPNKSSDWTSCGIYSMIGSSYADIDPLKVTSWIFGNPNPIGCIWVPIAGITEQVPGSAAAQKQGQFTVANQSPGVPGTLFIDQSKQTPDYGILTGINAALPALTVTFEGDTVVGVTKLNTVWYYRISLPGADGKPLYLTDATGKTGSEYFNTITNNGASITYPYGFFGPMLADCHNTAKGYSPNINADSTFVQTFGFHYLPDLYDKDTQQKFWIVSNVDYTKPRVDNYRYLAQVNTRLVFIGGTNVTDNVLVFQWGKAAGGAYTNLEVVGQGNIFGVKGGVRFLNATGNVEIYSIDGRLIKSAVLTGGDQVIDAPRGLAIVKAGSKVVKVVVQ